MWEILALALIFGLFLWASAWDSLELGVSTVIAAVFAFWWTGYPILDWVVANPVTLIVLLLVYAAAGGVWSVVKWRLWLGSQEEVIASSWKSFVDRQKSKGVQPYSIIGTAAEPVVPTDETLAGWRLQFLEEVASRWRAGDNKRRITAWIAWWPTSIIWTVANDIIVELWNWVYRFFVGLYDRMAGNVIDRNLK